MKINKFFNISNANDFKQISLEIFKFQAENNLVYKAFINYLHVDIRDVKSIKQIPFLPIQFFKSHKVISSKEKIQQLFLSSGTTGNSQSKHFVTDLTIYEKSFEKGFEYFYGSLKNYTILALLPSYLEREGSSLIYMVNNFIKKSKKPRSGFYLNNLDELHKNLLELDKNNEKTILIGVSFALLDLVEKYKFQLKNTIIMETGGMKGRRKELIREELHQILCEGFGVKKIHSEYGMTELLSQAYSKGNGIFKCPPWMKILIRDTEDALTLLPTGKSGGINVIDLANVNSCSFITTQDLGKIHPNNTFEVLGRFDNSDIRGCNLMVM
ncbi:acyl transferase [Lutibacter profundi]|uniref:Acyl transferase n=1 Tax=Lutibacter profundi TaxID=1622118 RepID=A0A0X8G7R2_9FLAO|nr:acyl transferase [Lutibacter profundi]AMC11228.1 acyl transferase [Lutibacter profundi]